MRLPAQKYFLLKELEAAIEHKYLITCWILEVVKTIFFGEDDNFLVIFENFNIHHNAVMIQGMCN